jgi:excisionase family DNA binding protein
MRSWDDYPDVMTIDHVREVYGLGENAAYRAVKTGEIPSFRIGKLIRFSKVALREFVENSGQPLPKAER